LGVGLKEQIGRIGSVGTRSQKLLTPFHPSYVLMPLVYHPNSREMVPQLELTFNPFKTGTSLIYI